MFTQPSGSESPLNAALLNEPLISNIVAGNKRTPCPPDIAKDLQEAVMQTGSFQAEERNYGVLRGLAAIDRIYNRNVSHGVYEETLQRLRAEVRQEVRKIVGAGPIQRIPNQALLSAMNTVFDEARPALTQLFLAPSLTAAYGFLAESLGFEAELRRAPGKYPSEPKIFVHLSRNGERYIMETSLSQVPYVNEELQHETFQPVTAVDLLNAEIEAAQQRSVLYESVLTALDVARLIVNPGNPAVKDELQKKLQGDPGGVFDPLKMPRHYYA